MYIVYRLSFLIFSHSIRFILGFRWCSGRGAKKVSREGAVAKCCRVLVGAHASRQGLCGWDTWLWRLQCQWRIPSSQCQALFFIILPCHYFGWIFGCIFVIAGPICAWECVPVRMLRCRETLPAIEEWSWWLVHTYNNLQLWRPGDYAIHPSVVSVPPAPSSSSSRCRDWLWCR